MPFLAPTLDNAYLFFALVKHQVFICTTKRWRIKTQIVAIYKLTILLLQYLLFLYIICK